MSRRSELAAIARLRRLADRETPALRDVILRALEQFRGEIQVERLENLLILRDAAGLHDLSATLPLRLRPATAALQRVFGLGVLSGRSLLIDAGIDMAFDYMDPFAVAAARRQAAQFVTRVTEETRRAIRSIVARAFAEGITPRDVARLVRPLVGLTERQARAVLRLRAVLRASGIAQRTIAARAATFADRLLRQRALMIARTETAAASSQGQIAAWDDAVRRGMLDPRSRKVWLTTDDDKRCPFCAALNDATVPLGAMFVSRGKPIAAPPAHPNCRCAVAVRPPSIAAARRAA